MSTNQDRYLATVAALMKRGQGDEIAQFFNSRDGEPEEETFVSYMDRLISRSRMSRTKIAEQVGLSRDFMYKVLRGAKKTTERDYIIAVCLSMKASLLETQRALELYPFPELDSSDDRSAIIMCAINERASIFTLNEWLERSNMPLLRVSPDMPTAKVGPVRSTVIRQNLIDSKATEGHDPSVLRSVDDMEITNTFVVVEHYGLAPVDFFYMAEYELTDENGKKVYVEACFWPGGASAFGVTLTTIEGHADNPPELIEQYETLTEARNSVYFPYFLELDKLTDMKAAETMRSLDDTKTYGFRRGAGMSKDGILKYAEAYNDVQPELNEYIQVRQTENGCIYSATHKSIFMQLEMQEFYEPYFGKPETPLFLFEVNSLDDLGPYEYYRESFEQMVHELKGV